MVSCEYLNRYHLPALPEYADTVDYFNPSHLPANSHALRVWILVLFSLSLLIRQLFLLHNEHPGSLTPTFPRCACLLASRTFLYGVTFIPPELYPLEGLSFGLLVVKAFSFCSSENALI